MVIESEGLMSALEELAANTEKMFHITCRFHCDSPVLIHNHSVATHLYRIAQEAVSNAIKHGKARQVDINLLSDVGGKRGSRSKNRTTAPATPEGGVVCEGTAVGATASAPRGRIVLVVQDNGLGLPKILPKNQGMGLRIMRYRAGMVGASLAVQTEPAGGASVICSLPEAPRAAAGKT